MKKLKQASVMALLLFSSFTFHTLQAQSSTENGFSTALNDAALLWQRHYDNPSLDRHTLAGQSFANIFESTPENIVKWTAVRDRLLTDDPQANVIFLNKIISDMNFKVN